MSLNPVRTIRTNGFRISSLALALTAVGLGGCDVPPEGADGVQAISSGLMAVMDNAVAAESSTATVQMTFSIGRPFDSTTGALDVVFSTLDFGSNPATAGSSCGPGVDYIAVPGRTLTFPAGATTITTGVTVCPDSVIEGTETFATHVVEAATGRCDGERCAAIGSITDPAGTPALPALRVNDVTASECLKGKSICHATFTISLSAASESDVTVQAATASDTAVSTIGGCLYSWLHPDFASVSTLVTIPAGATSATVNVPICSDTIGEPTERFFLNLSNSVNATIADGRGIGTILD